MPNDLRSTAIGGSITISGLGSAIFAWTAGYIWDEPSNFQSSQPFLAAATLGLSGCVGLFIFDRFIPIRQANVKDPLNARPAMSLSESSDNEGSTFEA